MPTIRRQKFRPSGVVWNAMMAADAVYHRSDSVNTERRPSRSATVPNISVPIKRPRNAAAMKLAMLSRLRKLLDVACSTPERTMPGAMYAVANNS
ncbi:hypothetical protein AWB68_08585 [Caballeronia choica]|uniref:Uncharacterized protein n=1 Tax=Caballeronia choica TaxID=326476 RepID=A0A158L3D5_9BURK|nr:hypothetical protein AWB68_08585 [Caballeronia choica]